jgi:hypothetical protein
MLNKQSRRADLGLTTHGKKLKFVTKCQEKPRTWADYLEKLPKENGNIKTATSILRIGHS